MPVIKAHVKLFQEKTVILYYMLKHVNDAFYLHITNSSTIINY